MTKVAVLASGSGSILASIIAASVPVSPVLTDKHCKALRIAQESGIPTELIDRRYFGYAKGVGEDWDREGFTHTVCSTLHTYGIDLVAMAGFFTVLHRNFFTEFQGCILNSHPSLLPMFKGEFAVRDALEAFHRGEITETGSSIHIATEILDDERFVLDQVRVSIKENDDVETLWERIKVQERIMYPALLWNIISGELDLAQLKGTL